MFQGYFRSSSNMHFYSGKVPIDPNKLNILWQRMHTTNLTYKNFLETKIDIKYDWYVFNSHWNYEKFRHYFDIPTERSVVIKNGLDYFQKEKFIKKVIQ